MSPVLRKGGGVALFFLYDHKNSTGENEKIERVGWRRNRRRKNSRTDFGV